MPTSKENIFLAKKNTWSLLKKNIRLEWSVYFSIIWYLSKVSPGPDEAAESVCLFEKNVWVRGVNESLTLPHSDKCTGLSVDSACKNKGSNIVWTFYILMAKPCHRDMSSVNLFMQYLYMQYAHLYANSQTYQQPLLKHTDTVPVYAEHTHYAYMPHTDTFTHVCTCTHFFFFAVAFP